jgi:hypothetical protein
MSWFKKPKQKMNIPGLITQIQETSSGFDKRRDFLTVQSEALNKEALKLKEAKRMTGFFFFFFF